MERKLVRRKQEDMMSKTRLRVHRTLGAFATGGFDSLDRIPDEKVEEIEQKGFDYDEIQRYINRLELQSHYAEAAMLRGAFNDLLDRIPDTPQEERQHPIEPAA